MLISTAFAAQAASTTESGTGSIVFMVAMIFVFYLLIIRPQTKRNNEQKKLISNLKEEDEVMMSSGIMGRIVKMTDQYLSVEVAKEIILKVQKNAVVATLPKGTLDSI